MGRWLNRAQMNVSNTPGTSSGFTLQNAISPYQTFQAAGAIDGKKYATYIFESPAWELRGDCVYTAVGTSLSRGTLKMSSTGSAINFSSAAIVTADPSAEDLYSLPLIEHVDVGAVNTVTIDNIPQFGKNLRCLFVGRTTTAAQNDSLNMKVNGSSSSIYSWQRSYSQNTTVSADQTLSTTGFNNMVSISGNTAPARVQGFCDLEIFDYANNLNTGKCGWFTGRQPNSTTTRNAFELKGSIDLDLQAGITSVTWSTASGANFAAGSFAEVWVR